MARGWEMLKCSNVTTKKSLTAGLLLFLLLMIPVTSFSTPLKAECSSTDVYERIKCKSDAISGQLEYTSDTAFAAGSRLHGHAKLERLKHINNAKTKAVHGKSRTNKDNFKKFAKNEAQSHKKELGHLIPLTLADDVDENGICDYQSGDKLAKCLAVELDIDGNAQACNPEKKNKGKKDGLECDLFFDGENPEDTQEIADEMEASFDAIESDLIEMNKQLDSVNAQPSAAFNVVKSESTDSCTLPDQTEGLSVAVAALRAVSAALSGAATIYDAASDQTIVLLGNGGNISGTASPLHYAALVGVLAYIITDEIYQAEVSELQAATMACVAQTAGAISELDAKIDALAQLIITSTVAIKSNDNANAAVIRSDIENLRSEMYDLLNTPQGQRESFNGK